MDKRYLLFGFDGYYPSGGFNDLIDSYDTIDEAIAKIKAVPGKITDAPGPIDWTYNYYQIYDRIEGRQIPLETLTEHTKNGG